MTPQRKLRGPRVVLRPGSASDAALLHTIRSEPSVAQWWGVADPEATIAAELQGESEEVVFVIEVDGEVAGAIQYAEENELDYRHASIDIYLATGLQGRGLGAEAVRLLAEYLIDERGHHRLTIDPARGNERAIKAYESVGFRTVGVLRQYGRGRDGSWHDGLLMDLLADELRRMT